MTEEERAALHRTNRVTCRANLIANELALAGDTVAAASVRLDWRALELALLEVPGMPDCTGEPVTAQNRDCIN